MEADGPEGDAEVDCAWEEGEPVARWRRHVEVDALLKRNKSTLMNQSSKIYSGVDFHAMPKLTFRISHVTILSLSDWSIAA